eukprot:1362086-Pleurochrysis_carterae.AAC.1
MALFPSGSFALLRRRSILVASCTAHAVARKRTLESSRAWLAVALFDPCCVGGGDEWDAPASAASVLAYADALNGRCASGASERARSTAGRAGSFKSFEGGVLYHGAHSDSARSLHTQGTESGRDSAARDSAAESVALTAETSAAEGSFRSTQQMAGPAGLASAGRGIGACGGGAGGGASCGPGGAVGLNGAGPSPRLADVAGEAVQEGAAASSVGGGQRCGAGVAPGR